MTHHHTFAALSLIMVTTFAHIVDASQSGASLNTEVQSAISTGQVRAVLKNGVATLYGNVEFRVDANAAAAAAARYDGVDTVINRIFVSD